MELIRTFDILENLIAVCPHKADMLNGKIKGKWIGYSVKEYTELTDKASCGLLALGLKKGDLVATISNNRPEWNIMDMAFSKAGVIHVPIYPTISEADYTYILSNCEPKYLIVADKVLYEKLKPKYQHRQS